MVMHLIIVFSDIADDYEYYSSASSHRIFYFLSIKSIDSKGTQVFKSFVGFFFGSSPAPLLLNSLF
jgi:hypothetical protein